ncbi:unnamed protein product [Cyprideis torosa]|uniref:Uncharacterized protein n=1 Tax=Cyprideis torosa TaxID=163714 RepID=A0A7R8WDH6_9CRUS|nr:unnamed protein product [Cyprideis torosa]CAG0894645.1 unnamed protein product [Cyprideis torosa]
MPEDDVEAYEKLSAKLFYALHEPKTYHSTCIRLGPPLAPYPNRGVISVRFVPPSWARDSDDLPTESALIDYTGIQPADDSEDEDCATSNMEDLFAGARVESDAIDEEEEVKELRDFSADDGWDSRVLEEFLRETLRCCDVVNLEDLCIASSRIVWHLHCELHGLDRDGAEWECALLALIAALRNLLLPEVKFNVTADGEMDCEVHTAVKALLRVRVLPMVATIAFFDNKGEQVLVDPTRAEIEQCDGGCVRVALTDDGKILFFQFFGAMDVCLTVERRKQILRIAQERTEMLRKCLL